MMMLVVSGCQFPNILGGSKPQAKVAPAPTSSTAPATPTIKITPKKEFTTPAVNMKQEIVDPTMARVNNEPIRKSDLTDALIKSYGRKILDEMMVLEMVRQRAKSQSIETTPKLIDLERRGLLAEMAPNALPQNREALLDYLLQSRGLSKPQFEMILERQALLRQMVDHNVEVSDDMIFQEYEFLHGKKVTIRLISNINLRIMESIKKRVQSGEDFVMLMRKYSEDQASLANDGVIGPFTKSDQRIHPKIRDAAFKLVREGDTSDLISFYDQDDVYRWYFLRAEAIVRADGTSYSDAKFDMVESIQKRTINQRMNQLLDEIKTESKTLILDSELRKAK